MKVKVSLLLLFFCPFLFGQKIIECSEKKSFWIIKNNSDLFAVELLGKVKDTENPNLVSLNNRPMQYLLVDKSKFVTDENKGNDFEILKAYVESERGYLNEILETELEIKKFKVELKGNITTLFWYYKMPEKISTEVKFQLFVSMVLDDKIFGLATSQFTDQDFNSLQTLLLDTLYSLKKIEAEKNICN